MRRPPVPPLPPTDPSDSLYIDDVGSPAKIWADQDKFWNRYFGGTDQEWSDAIDAEFASGSVGFWSRGAQAAALVQMYDLVVTVDPCAAGKYLSRLRVIGEAFLRNRDDKRHAQADWFRDRVMPAWGAPAADGHWDADLSIAGLFTYAMSAFARRVADDPTRFSQSDRDTAVQFINATMETYDAYRPEMHLSDDDPFAYYVLPHSYANLECCAEGWPLCSIDPSYADKECANYRDGAGQPIAWNENLSMMIGLAEFALAANTPFFRATTDESLVNAFSLYYATKEVPRLVAKDFAFFYAYTVTKIWSDGTPYLEWYHQSTGNRIQDTQHGSFELASVAVLYDDQERLNAILMNESRPERLDINSTRMKAFATTFLRLIWQNIPNDRWDSNTLSENVDGTGAVRGHYSVHNGDCAGYVPLAQFDPWVWTRCRDTTFNDTTDMFLNVSNHAALLRYRERTPGASVSCVLSGARGRAGALSDAPVLARGQ